MGAFPDHGQGKAIALRKEGSLEQAGLTFSDVVEIVSYHVDLKTHIQDFIIVKDEFVAEPYPAWTVLGVSELVSDGALVEIKVTAKL